MSLALWCVFIAAFLPYPFTLAAKWSKRFDNARPRDYLGKLEGWRQRAHWVQLNSFESFPAFAAAVIIAQLQHAPQARIDSLALAFIVLRVLFGLCYVADKAVLRSLMWLGASGCVVALFIAAASAGV